MIPNRQVTKREFGDQFRRVQRATYDECREANWDPDDKNSLSEELMHIVAEITEAFEQWRLHHRAVIAYEPDGKPTGIPIEFADALIGLLYNAQRMGFDLWEALEIKREWNRKRDYVAEGRQLNA